MAPPPKTLHIDLSLHARPEDLQRIRSIAATHRAAGEAMRAHGDSFLELARVYDDLADQLEENAPPTTAMTDQPQPEQGQSTSWPDVGFADLYAAYPDRDFAPFVDLPDPGLEVACERCGSAVPLAEFDAICPEAPPAKHMGPAPMHLRPAEISKHRPGCPRYAPYLVGDKIVPQAVCKCPIVGDVNLSDSWAVDEDRIPTPGTTWSSVFGPWVKVIEAIKPSVRIREITDLDTPDGYDVYLPLSDFLASYQPDGIPEDGSGDDESVPGPEPMPESLDDDGIYTPRGTVVGDDDEQTVVGDSTAMSAALIDQSLLRGLLRHQVSADPADACPGDMLFQFTSELDLRDCLALPATAPRERIFARLGQLLNLDQPYYMTGWSSLDAAGAYMLRLRTWTDLSPYEVEVDPDKPGFRDGQREFLVPIDKLHDVFPAVIESNVDEIRPDLLRQASSLVPNVLYISPTAFEVTIETTPPITPGDRGPVQITVRPTAL